ncbi:hypothetical protein H4R33_000687 [Dimargaris cristalligena]|uniref:MMS19 nucleotide excision repair protein n=1 Tax=Dimargaris cristalligena TaxID=215637 RepID=A0A4Q0A2L0_9FUNG|nr:hypothetical protein H4R33_000687 [Dimargaris cristalligena]RKP40307.1 Dos2-interacting transcription regulator of RNA-Pol-II-domain-containing protein [Dimargaris cristalligena]|eukprot:RKP40307.1 Dos2-interacting transcription regulator of RNA-Pol-II-domain-containing protein [Dimargaris cristalligena]
MDSGLIDTYLAALENSSDRSGQEQALQAILDSIHQGDNSLLTLVQGLEKPLTSERNEWRAKGIKLLATVIRRLDDAHIAPPAVKFLTNFFRERLADTPCVPWLVEGLTNLSHTAGFRQGDFAGSVVESLLEEIHIQSFQQPTRLAILHLLQYLLTEYLPTLQRQLPSLPALFIQAMDSEKDPRNLMVCFDLFPRIVRHFDVTGHADDLFEVVFCYFPITFKPPPGDALGVTAEDLKAALRHCIAATPAFGPYAIEPLLSKLTSSSGSAKIDALQTLAECASVFTPADWQPHMAELASLIREEIYQTTDDALRAQCLSTLATLFARVTQDKAPTAALTEDPHEFVKPLIDDLVAQVADAQWVKAIATGKILSCIAATSLYNCIMIVRPVLPLFLTSNGNSDSDPISMDTERAHIEILGDILDASRVAFSSPEVSQYPDLQSFWKTYEVDLYHRLSASVPFFQRSPQSQDVLLTCSTLLAAVSVPTAFDATDKRGAYLTLREVYLAADGKATRDYLLNLLHQLAQRFPEVILDATVEPLRQHLPDVYDAGRIHPQLHLELALVAKLGAVPQLARPYLEILLPVIQATPGQTTPLPPPEACFRYTDAVLQTVGELLDALTGPEDRAWVAETVIPTLLIIAVAPTFRGDAIRLAELSTLDTLVPISAFGQDAQADQIAHSLASALAGLTPEQQTPLFASAFRLFMYGDTTPYQSLLPAQDPATTLELPFNPINQASATALEALSADHRLIFDRLQPYQRQTCRFWAALGATLHAAVPWPESDPAAIMKLLLTTALADESGSYGDSLALLIASWVNKAAPASLTLVEQDLLPVITHACTDSTRSQVGRLVALTIYLALTKAVVLLAGGGLQSQLVDQLLGWLRDPVLAPRVAVGLGHIVRDHPFALTRAAHARVKLLYRQKFFVQCLPGLVQGYRTAAASSSNSTGLASTQNHQQHRYYLLALSHMVQYIPKPVLMAELSSLMPLLLSSLELPHVESCVSTINTLYTVALDASDLMAEYIGSVVKALLRLTSARKSSSTATTVSAESSSEPPLNPMQVRTAALKCLAILPECLEYSIIHPYRKEVIKALAGPLDDRKRAVRQEAVVCRNKWFGASSSGAL